MNNKNNILRLLPIIGITLTIIGYLYLTYQTFTLNERRNELSSEIIQLENIKLRLTNETKLKDTIINIQDSIISKSSDLVTVKQGERLKIKFNEPVETHFVVTKNANMELAKKYELEGFNYLLEMNVNNAILSFRKSENSYNGFNMVYDIAFYLNKNKNVLSSKNKKIWNSAYKKILKDYSWKMPEEIKIKLIAKTK